MKINPITRCLTDQRISVMVVVALLPQLLNTGDDYAFFLWNQFNGDTVSQYRYDAIEAGRIVLSELRHPVCPRLSEGFENNRVK